MKVVHISALSSGGAYIAMRRLHDGLKLLGVDSKILTLGSSLSDADVVQFEQKRGSVFKRLSNKMRSKLMSLELNAYKTSRPQGLDPFSDARSIFEISQHPLVQEADVINLHWVASMLDYEEFFKRTMNKPIVITLHDMNPFTGGCHYSAGCIQYKTGCGACPQLGSKNPNDLSRKIYQIKEKSFRRHNPFVVGASSWISDCAKESILFKDIKLDTCHYNLPTDTFKNQKKVTSRDLLRLPQDKALILFGADYSVERKGLKYLTQSLPLLKNNNFHHEVALVTFGPNEPALSRCVRDMGISIYELGRINNEAKLAQVYSAADIFVMPSLEENLGQTCLEAMACGVPVIGTNVGGTPDMIKSGKTGILVNPGSAEALAQAIDWMMSHPREREEMGVSGRKLVEEKFAFPIQAKRYVQVYEALLRGE